MTKEIVKIGNVEMSREKLEQIDIDNYYICSYVGVFQIFFSAAQNRYYGRKIINKKGMAQRGRFYILSAKNINDILGQKILIER